MIKKYKTVIILLFVFLATFLYTLFVLPADIDEIWEFGYGYNIATGLIPYRDFNMVATPLYPFLISIFIRIIGPYLFSVTVFNAIILTGIFYILYKMLKYKSFVLVPFIMMYSYPTYNNLLLFLFFLFIYTKNSKISDNKKQICSALLISFMFLTKQSVGALFLILEFFLTKEKKKYLLFFSIPIVILGIYLLLNHALYNFIDYTFLGLLDFGTRNGNINIIFIVWLVLISITVFLYIKYRKKDILYALAYQAISFPIFDLFHTNMTLIALIFVVLEVFSKYLYKKYILMIVLFFSAFLITNKFDLNFKIYKEDNYLLYKKYDKFISVTIDETSKIIDRYKDKYDKIYNLTRHSYMVKLYRKDTIEKFDMTLNGNMGYKGYKKYIKDIDDYCKKHKCLLIIAPKKDDNYTQKNYEIIDYVTSNYNLIENNFVLGYDIYSN